MPKKQPRRTERLDNRKKLAIVREYRKLLKQKKREGSNVAACESTSSVSEPSQRPFSSHRSKTKNSLFQQALIEYNKKKTIAEQKREEKERIIRERNEALNRYKEKKKEKFKKLSRKTKWGQPAMNPRIELLLEKIQRSSNYQDVNK